MSELVDRGIAVKQLPGRSRRGRVTHGARLAVWCDGTALRVMCGLCRRGSNGKADKCLQVLAASVATATVGLRQLEADNAGRRKARRRGGQQQQQQQPPAGGPEDPRVRPGGGHASEEQRGSQWNLQPCQSLLTVTIIVIQVCGFTPLLDPRLFLVLPGSSCDACEVHTPRCRTCAVHRTSAQAGSGMAKRAVGGERLDPSATEAPLGQEAFWFPSPVKNFFFFLRPSQVRLFVSGMSTGFGPLRRDCLELSQSMDTLSGTVTSAIGAVCVRQQRPSCACSMVVRVCTR